MKLKKAFLPPRCTAVPDTCTPAPGLPPTAGFGGKEGPPGLPCWRPRPDPHQLPPCCLYQVIILPNYYSSF